LTAGSGIVQQDGGAVVVAGTTTLSAKSANDITLSGSGNDFDSLRIISGKNVSLVDVDNVNLGPSTISGTLNLTASGAVTDWGNVVVYGATTLAAGSANNITLDSSGNDFNTVKITSGKNVTLVDVDNVNWGASTVSGALSVTSGGAITDSGNLLVTGTTTLAAGAANNITLDSAGNNFSTVKVTSGKNVTLVDADAINLTTSTVSGNLNITANGPITDSGNLLVTGTTTLASGAANNITLDSAGNNFSTVGVSSGRTVTLVDVNGIDLGASTISGGLNVTAHGAITDSGDLLVTWAAKLSAGAANNITLNNTGNNFSSVSITSGKAVTLVDANTINLGTSAVSGSLNVTSHGSMTLKGNINAGSNNVTLNAGTGSINGSYTVTGGIVSLNAATVGISAQPTFSAGTVNLWATSSLGGISANLLSTGTEPTVNVISAPGKVLLNGDIIYP
jgi:hypothetical protein